MTKQRFYIDTRGNDDQAYQEAMEHACKIANADAEIQRVILLINTQRNTGWFERLYGEQIVKLLFKGYQFKNCKPLFKFETQKTYNDYSNHNEIVITCGLSSEDVFKIDDYYSVKVIIAIPWLKENLEKWIQTWNPIELRGKQEASRPYPEPSCIVKMAMKELSNSINMSTGILNPFDEEQAKTYILALHKYEPSLDENIVGAYLVKELDWETEHAKDIEKLIKTLNSGKYFKGGARTGLQDYYRYWKEKCKK